MNRENKRKTFEKGYYKTHACQDSFTCKVCGRLCTPESAGSNHRNHCPNCLSSLHVDIEPGDRESDCGGIMEPIAVWVRKGGEWRFTQRFHGDAHQFHRIIVCCHAVGAQGTAALTAMNDAPFPLERIEEMTALMGGDGRMK